MTIPALSVTCGDSSPKGRAKGLHSSTECLHVIRFGRTEPSAPTTVYRTCALSLPCHSEGAKRPWESVPLFMPPTAKGRHLPLPLRGKGAI